MKNVMRKQSYSYLTDDIEKVAETFQNDVDEAKGTIERSGIFEDFPGITHAPRQNQYGGVIFWYEWTFSPEILEELSERYYIDITSIHIMPYRITKDVVKAAKLRGKKVNGKKVGEFFNEAILQNPEYCDYDPTTGNFHMKPNGKYQVVLVAGGGPGWKVGKSIIESENIDDRLKKIKDNYYFPHITSEDNTEESIATLVIDALQALAAVLGPDSVLSQRLKK